MLLGWLRELLGRMVSRRRVDVASSLGLSVVVRSRMATDGCLGCLLSQGVTALKFETQRSDVTIEFACGGTPEKLLTTNDVPLARSCGTATFDVRWYRSLQEETDLFP